MGRQSSWPRKGVVQLEYSPQRIVPNRAWFVNVQLASQADSRLRDRSKRKIKYQENDAAPEKIKRKIVFSDLRNPPKSFTPLFGEVAKLRTLTKKDEQKSRDGEEAERCLPQAT